MRSLARRVSSVVVIAGLKLFTLVTNRPRARVLVLDESGRVLLLQQYISHGKWTLPGGGLERGELAVAAARRELREETGILVEEEALTYLGTLRRPDYDIPFIAPVFSVRVQATALPRRRANPREIMAVRWFDPDQLPIDVSQTVLAALALYRSQQG